MPFGMLSKQFHPTGQPDPVYSRPRTVRENHPPAADWSTTTNVINELLVGVPDVGARFSRAVANGAKILSEIEEGGAGRRYRAEDPNGQRWHFLQAA